LIRIPGHPMTQSEVIYRINHHISYKMFWAHLYISCHDTDRTHCFTHGTLIFTILKKKKSQSLMALYNTWFCYSFSYFWEEVLGVCTITTRLMFLSFWCNLEKHKMKADSTGIPGKMYTHTFIILLFKQFYLLVYYNSLGLQT
jgi:hypothetical protein